VEGNLHYNLSHLTQVPSQAVLGPIQDDEALLLFAVCRVVCAKRIAEFGGQFGYSAQNFLAAVNHCRNGIVYTIDYNPIRVLSPSHRPIYKMAKDVVSSDFNDESLDLVFFDCHDFEQQLHAFETLSRGGIITKSTIIALHDTGTHPFKTVPWAYLSDDGYVHQTAERRLANKLRDIGYECISFHAPRPPAPLQYRHGLTLCQPKSRFLVAAPPVP
jgi:predicted O-methyltransferase YrrM